MSFWDIFLKLCSKERTTPSAVCGQLGLSNAAASKWKKGAVPNSVTLQKISDHFGVSVSYLLGETDEKKPTSGEVSEEDIKVALFGGADDVTDEMWEEVKRYADYIRSKRNSNP